MLKRIYTFFLCLLVILIPLTSLGEQQNTARLLFNNIMNDYSTGNTKQLYPAVKQLLYTCPDHHLAAIFYPDLAYYSKIVGNQEIHDLLRHMIKKCKSAGAHTNLLLLHIELEKILLMSDPGKNDTVPKQFKPISDWYLMGPYHKYGAADLDHPFLPELQQFAHHTDAPPRVLRPVTNTGTVNPANKLYPVKGIAYAVTTITNQGPYKIRIYSDSPYKLFINGTAVLTNKPGNLNAANVRVLRIEPQNGITLAIKIAAHPTWKFRAIITDMNDRPITPRFNLNQFKTVKNFTTTELFEYPYNRILSDNNLPEHQKSACLGHYFQNISNIRAISSFRKAGKQAPTALNKYFLAQSSISFAKSRSSSLYTKGLQIINSYFSGSNFIPARLLLARQYTIAGNDTKALSIINAILVRSPGCLEAHKLKLQLFNKLGYDHEFKSALTIFKKKFPYSVTPYQLEAEYFKTRNKKRYEQALTTILKHSYSDNYAEQLINYYISAGNYPAALKIINTFNRNDKFTDQKIYCYIKTGNFKQAQKHIFREIIQRSNPHHYIWLGLLNYQEGLDPSMYWLKAVQIKPSLFSLNNYLDYSIKMDYQNPYRNYVSGHTKGATEGTLDRYPSTILKQDRIFHLYKGGGSKIYCRDIVYINKESAISKWGEYKIPFSQGSHSDGDSKASTLELINVRVITDENREYDSYTFHTIDGNRYISINALTHKSILTISYILTNSIQQARGSDYFTSPRIGLQTYNEPILESNIKIIMPEDMPLSYFFNTKYTTEQTSIDGNKIVSLTAKNIPAVPFEYYSGSRHNSLLNFTYSGMDTLDELWKWYSGLLEDAAKPDFTRNNVSLKGTTLEATIKKIYDHISSEIRLQKNILYHPSSPRDTLYLKKGTVEDKVILTRELLHEYGIKSYIAFVKNKYHQPMGNLVHPEIFSHMLLYIPINQNTSIWLDYSNEYYGCGTVANECENATAYVFMKHGIEQLQVKGTVRDYSRISLQAIIDENGDGNCVITSQYNGKYAPIKKSFRNKQYNGQKTAILYNNILPLFELESFKIKNLHRRDQPFTLEAHGKCHGIALVRDKQCILEPIIQKSSLYNYILYQKREQPLSLPHIGEISDYTYIIPERFSAQKINRQKIFKSSFGEAQFIIKKAKNSTKLEAHKRITIQSRLIPAADYPDFLKFCLQIKKFENSTIVLTHINSTIKTP